MVHVNVSEFRTKFSHYLRLAQAGERVIICQRNKPAFELVLQQERPPLDRKKRDSAFEMFKRATESEVAPQSEE